MAFKAWMRFKLRNAGINCSDESPSASVSNLAQRGSYCMSGSALPKA